MARGPDESAGFGLGRGRGGADVAQGPVVGSSPRDSAQAPQGGASPRSPDAEGVDRQGEADSRPASSPPPAADAGRGRGKGRGSGAVRRDLVSDLNDPDFKRAQANHYSHSSGSSGPNMQSYGGPSTYGGVPYGETPHFSQGPYPPYNGHSGFNSGGFYPAPMPSRQASFPMPPPQYGYPAPDFYGNGYSYGGPAFAPGYQEAPYSVYLSFTFFVLFLIRAQLFLHVHVCLSPFHVLAAATTPPAAASTISPAIQ